MGSVFRLPIRHGSDDAEVVEFTRRPSLRRRATGAIVVG
jgi:hypothetical protein